MITALPSHVVSPFSIARILRAEASLAVAQNASVGTAVVACMGLLVASAATKRKSGGGVVGFRSGLLGLMVQGSPYGSSNLVTVFSFVSMEIFHSNSPSLTVQVVFHSVFGSELT